MYWSLAFLDNLGSGEMLVILLVAFMIYGNRLPEMARNLGKGYAQFKRSIQDATSEMERQIQEERTKKESAPSEPVPLPEVGTVAPGGTCAAAGDAGSTHPPPYGTDYPGSSYTPEVTTEAQGATAAAAVPSASIWAGAFAATQPAPPPPAPLPASTAVFANFPVPAAPVAPAPPAVAAGVEQPAVSSDAATPLAATTPQVAGLTLPAPATAPAHA